MKLLASKSANYQRRPAQDAMEAWIKQFPQIDGVLAANNSMAAAAVDGWRSATARQRWSGSTAARKPST